ncbi:MAG TPA: ATP-binding cassette domain-containing protein [Jiangellaceae bacterium]
MYADGTHALDALELRLPAGSFFGLLGPNGVGKTTLIGSVAGLVRAPAGRMFVFGRDAVADPRARLLLGLAGLASATEVGQEGCSQSRTARP